MPKSRGRKPKPANKTTPKKNWWIRHRASVWSGISGGVWSGCMSNLAIAIALPLAVILW